MDEPIPRRGALAYLTALGAAALLVACSRDDGGLRETGSSTSGDTPDPGTAAGDDPADCVLTPEQTEGPYYVDTGLVRADITEDRLGAPLELRLKVVDAATCTGLPGAAVDIWHADANGDYSGVVPRGDSGPASQIEDATFLRGVQNTAKDGVATFRTIYPGWYPGRAVHIHVMVRTDGTKVHTGQLYFDEELTTTLNQEREPYSQRGAVDTSNSTDGIYDQGGPQSTLRITPQGDGYVGTITLGVEA